MNLKEVKNVENISLDEFFKRVENNQLFIEFRNKNNVDNVFRRFLKSYIPREAGRISDVFSDEAIGKIKKSIIDFEILSAIQISERTPKINRGLKDPLEYLNSDSFKEALIENLKNMNDKDIEEFFGGDFENVLKAYEGIETEDIKEIIKSGKIEENIATFLNIIKLKFEYIGDTFQGKLNDVKHKHLANFKNVKKNLESDFKPFIDDLVRTIESFGGKDYKENLIEIQELIDNILKSYRKVIEESVELFERKIGYSTTLYAILMNDSLSLKEKVKEIQDLNELAREEINDYFEIVNYAQEFIKKAEEKEVFEKSVEKLGNLLKTNKRIYFSDIPFLVDLLDEISDESIKDEIESIILTKSEPEKFAAKLKAFYEKYKNYDYIKPYEEFLSDLAESYSNDVFHKEFSEYLQDYLYKQINESEPIKKLIEKYQDRFIVANKYSTQFIHKLFQEAYENAVKNEDEEFSNFYIAGYLTQKALITEKVENDYFNLYKYVGANKKGQNLLAEILTDENFSVLDTPTQKAIVRDIMEFIKQEWEKGVANQAIRNDFLAFYEDAGVITSLITELNKYDLLEEEYVQFLEEINKYFDLYADDNTYIRNLYAKNALNELTYQTLKSDKRHQFEKMSYDEFSDYFDKKIIQDKNFGKDVFNVILVEAKNKAVQDFFEKKDEIKKEIDRNFTREIVNREINKRIVENIKKFYKTELEYMVSKAGDKSVISDIDEYVDNVIGQIVLNNISFEQLNPNDFIERIFERYSNSRILRKLNEQFLKEKINDDYVLMALKQQALTSFKDINRRFVEIAHKELNNTTGRFREEILKLPDEKIAVIRDKIAEVLRAIPDRYDEELEKTVEYLKTELPLSEGEIRNYLINMTEPYKTNKKSLLADVDVVLSGDEKEQADLIANNLKITKKGEIKPPEEDVKSEKEFEEDFAKFLSMKSSQFVEDKTKNIGSLKDRAVEFINKRLEPGIKTESFSKYAMIGKEEITLDMSYKTLSKNIDVAIKQKGNYKSFEDKIEAMTFRGQMLMNLAPFFVHFINTLKTESQQLKEAIQKNQKVIIKNNYMKHNVDTFVAAQKTMVGAIPVAMLVFQDVKSIISWSMGRYKQPTLEEIDRKLRRIKTLKGVYSKMKFWQVDKNKNPFSALQIIEEHLRYKRESIMHKVAVNKQNLRRITATLKNFNDISEYVIQNAPANSPHLANVIKELTNEGEYKIFRKKFKKIDDLITKATELEYSNDVGQREKERLRNIIYREYERNQELRKKAMFRAYEVAFSSKNPREQIEILQNIKDNNMLTHEQKEELLEQVKKKMLENIKKDTMGSVFLLMDEDFINLPKVQKFLARIDLDSNPVEGLDEFSSLIENRILKSALSSQDNNLKLKDFKKVMEKEKMDGYDKQEVAEIIKELREALTAAITEIKTFEDLERIMEVKLSLLREKEEKQMDKVKSASKLKALGKVYSKFAKLSPYTFRNFFKNLKEFSLADRAIQDVISKNAQTYSVFRENMYKLLGEIDPEDDLIIQNKLKELFVKHNGDLKSSFEELVGVSIEDYYLNNLDKLSILTEETLKEYPDVYNKFSQLKLDNAYKTYLAKRLLEKMLSDGEESVKDNFDNIVENIMLEINSIDFEKIEQENLKMLNSILEMLNKNKAKNVEEALDMIEEKAEEIKSIEAKKSVFEKLSDFGSIKRDVIEDMIKEQHIKEIKDFDTEEKENSESQKVYKFKNIMKIFDKYKIPQPLKEELYEFIENNDLNSEENYKNLIERFKNLDIGKPEELAEFIKSEKDYHINVIENPYNKKLENENITNNLSIYKLNEKTSKIMDSVLNEISNSELKEYKNRIINDIVNVFKNNEEITVSVLRKAFAKYNKIDPVTTEKLINTLFEHKGLFVMMNTMYDKQLQLFKPLSADEIKALEQKQLQREKELQELQEIREARTKWESQQQQTSGISK